MAYPALTDEQLRATVAAIEEHGSELAAAKALGISRSTLRHRNSAAAKRGLSPQHGLRHPYPDGFRMGKTTIQRGPQGQIERTWERMVEDRARQMELAGEIVAEMAQGIPAERKAPRPRLKTREELLVALPWGDPHFGMYSWAEETGNNFDLDIARDDLCGAVRYLVRSTPPAKRCLLANLGDFYHADNLDGTTVKSGHILDMDSRLPKMVRVGVSAMRTAIHTALRRHEQVEVVNAPGNHDPVLGLVMSILLANVYQDEPRVKIHDTPTFRHYVRHGNVLIGITHGDKTKDRDLPGIMATEKPEDWGQTKFRYYWRGHHHHDTRQEFNGCTVEQFRTLAPGDSFAVSRGFLSGRDMKAIVLHREFGEVARQTCSIDLLRSQQGEAT